MMSAAKAQTPPAGLARAGKALWKSIVVPGFILRADEKAVLTQACFLADDIEKLTKAVAKEPALIAGSHKQTVTHPGLAELRQMRQALASLLGKIDIPEKDGGAEWDGLSASQRARKASRARWDKRGSRNG